MSSLHIYNSPLEDETKVQPFSTINRLMNCTIKLLNKKVPLRGAFYMTDFIKSDVLIELRLQKIANSVWLFMFFVDTYYSPLPKREFSSQFSGIVCRLSIIANPTPHVTSPQNLKRS